MYKDSEDGAMTGGTIIAVSEDSGELTVQRREQDKGMGKSWMPSWQDTKTAHVHTGKKCPQGYSEHTDKIQGGSVLMTGELTMTHRMTDATYRRAISLQLMSSAPKLAPDMDWRAAPDTGWGCRLNIGRTDCDSILRVRAHGIFLQEDFWFLRIDERTCSVLYLHTDTRTRTTSC